MKITADLHTHTVFSGHGHGKGSIEENVIAARNRGIKTIGISDHASDHIMFGVNPKDYFKMRREIERLKQKYPDMQILLGVEANIINKSGKLAISKETAEMFDYVMAGYHFGTMGESLGMSLTVHALNAIGASGGTHRQRLKAINTELAMRAIEMNNIKVLTHPSCKGGIDVKEVAKLCAQRGTLMEINDHHRHLNAEELKEAAKTDVKFIIGSDAHRPEHVGNHETALTAAIESGIDLSRIVNLVQEA